MQYTTITLFALSMLGILIHTLMKIQGINKRQNGNFKFWPFIRLEWPSLLISICVVVVSLIARAEIATLKQVGNYLGIGFVALGYMSQSIIYHFAGKAEKMLKNDE